MNRDQQRALITRYECGESVDISGLPEPTQNRLRDRRAQREAQRVAYEQQRQREKDARERDLEIAYLAAGGDPAGWRREGPAICAADRASRTRDALAAGSSLVDLRALNR